MAESFTRWESDPLFSAAEVVQDSADRMESLYRTLLHEQNLVPESPSRHQIALQYHKRDLTTALETTRWQLEDFEREVNLAAFFDESKLRENAILKHRHFIRAIRELILQVERSVYDSSVEVSNENPAWMNLNEQEKDMLTSFLSGGTSGGEPGVEIADYDNGNSIMRRFLNSPTDNSEIIELNPADVEIRIGSHLPDKHVQGFAGQEEISGSSDLEFGDLGAKYYPYNKRTRVSVWGLMRSFWLGKHRTRSAMKRRKDGEMTDLMEDSEQRLLSSIGAITPDQQGILECLLSTMRFSRFIEILRRRFHRSHHPSLHNRLSGRFVGQYSPC